MTDLVKLTKELETLAHFARVQAEECETIEGFQYWKGYIAGIFDLVERAKEC